MIEKILYSWLSTVCDQPVYQEDFNGKRNEKDDHLSFKVLNITPISEEKIKKLMPDGKGILDVCVTNEVQVSVQSYGYKSYECIKKLYVTAKYDANVRSIFNGYVSVKDQPAIVNTSFLNDAEHEPRWTATFNLFYNCSVEVGLDLISQFILTKCSENGGQTMTPFKVLESNSTDIHFKSSSFVAECDNIYVVDSSGGPVIATVSQQVTNGCFLQVIDANATASQNTISVSFPGKKLHGSSPSIFNINCDGKTAIFRYVLENDTWYVVSS